ncbi:MAG: ferrous iron transporter B, partial [Clostridiaceae bacterium]|nr:ferrous iron transporter B [Clostridiaceae bacterium]
MGYTFALVGNPNCGKTTMFNEITGSTQYVGNWPGVTVEKKEGRAKKIKEEVKVIDLPGIYSLSPYTMEEIVARDYIIDERPDVVINIVEATNIERNLYLTTQLMELGVPVVVALNMMDALEAKGDKINIQQLEKCLGVPVIPTSASKGQGIGELMEKALASAQTAAVKAQQQYQKIYDEKIEKCISQVEASIENKTPEKYNLRWTAIKLLEGDERVNEKLTAVVDIISGIKEYQQSLEKEYDNDMETIIADNRYRFITDVVSKAVKKKSGGGLTMSDKIDRVVTNRILAIPLFLLVMYSVFQVTFGAVGSAT